MGGGGSRVWRLTGIWDDENAPELARGDGCTTMWLHWNSLTYAVCKGDFYVKYSSIKLFLKKNAILTVITLSPVKLEGQHGGMEERWVRRLGQHISATKIAVMLGESLAFSDLQNELDARMTSKITFRSRAQSSQAYTKT